MLNTVVIFFTLYTLTKLWVSISQIRFISTARHEEAVLMSSELYDKAAGYALEKERINIVEHLIEFVLFIFWVYAGLEMITSWVEDTTLGTILFMWIFFGIGFVITLPIELYRTFALDKKYEFTKTTKALFFKDKIISSVIFLVVSALIVWVVAWIITSSTMWWLYTFIFLTLVVIAMNILFPIVRAAFFDKLSHIEEGELKTRLEKLFSENGFDAQGLYISDASSRDARLNAYFAGLGKNKRVVLFDTLVEKLSISELEAVLGHELGHYNNKDIIKNIAMISMIIFTTLALFGNLPQSLYSEMGLNQTPALLMALFVLLSSPLFFVLMPIMGKLSRHNEFQADAMGAKLGGKENLVSALKKLVTENKAFPKSSKPYLFFYATHPPVLERFEAMGVDPRA